MRTGRDVPHHVGMPPGAKLAVSHADWLWLGFRLRHWFRAGKWDREGRALLWRCLQLDLPTVRFDDGRHDREAQPGAAFGARTRLVDAVEAVEDVRGVLRRDARSRVSHP